MPPLLAAAPIPTPRQQQMQIGIATMIRIQQINATKQPMTIAAITPAARLLETE